MTSLPAELQRYTDFNIVAIERNACNATLLTAIAPTRRVVQTLGQDCQTYRVLTGDFHNDTRTQSAAKLSFFNQFRN